jgi:hypothetical protein
VRCSMSSFVSPFATKSQSMPTSLQLTVSAMLISSDGFFMRISDCTVLTQES